MKIKEGDVFSIKTKIGYGFIQFIAISNLGIELVRVLEQVKPTDEITQEEINIKERYSVQFAAVAALKKKLIEKVSEFKILADYQIPIKARSKHNVRGEFLGWHIVDQKTLKHELKHDLSQDEILLSPHGIPNDTILIEWLESDWRLENWK